MNRKPTIDLQPHPHPILENPHDNVVVGNSGLKLSSTTSQAGIIDEYPSSTAVGTSYARPPLVPNSKNKRANASKKAHQAPQASATTTRSNGAPKKILPSDMMKQLLEFDVFLQEERHRMSAEMKTASDPL